MTPDRKNTSQLPTALTAFALLVVSVSGCARPDGDDPRFSACRRVLLEQARAWNRGDLEGFARGYLESPHTAFITADGTTLGYSAMLARYRKRYPDKKAMGRLDFSELRFEAVDEQSVVVRGRWRLRRTKDAPHGQFVLIMRRVAGAWRVAVDFTTLNSK